MPTQKESQEEKGGMQESVKNVYERGPQEQQRHNGVLSLHESSTKLLVEMN